MRIPIPLFLVGIFAAPLCFDAKSAIFEVSGLGSLKTAIRSSSPGDEIRFVDGSGARITETVIIPWDLTISGGPTTGSTLVGNRPIRDQTTPMLDVQPGVDLKLNDLQFTGAAIVDTPGGVPSVIIGRGDNHLSISNCYFQRNLGGPAILLDTAAPPDAWGIRAPSNGSLQLTGCNFNSNRSSSDQPLIELYAPSLSIHGCLFHDNQNSPGSTGNPLLRTLVGSGTADIRRTQFILNGGPPFVSQGSIAITMGQCEFSHNAGGISLSDDDVLRMVQCTISGSPGRVMYIGDGVGFSATQSTFTQCGGGFYVDDDAQFFHLEHCTVVDNSGVGAGIDIDHIATEVTIRNSIIAQNSRYDPPTRTFIPANVVGVYEDLGGNLIGGDPMLGELASNGGPTRFRIPLPQSPAIDFGVLTAASLADQRGYERVTGTAPDAGAAESDAGPLTDANGDGIADSWAFRFDVTDAQQDSDGDGRSNFEEFTALTNPQDRESHLAIKISHFLPGRHLTISWRTTPGIFYRPEQSTDLTRWVPVQSKYPF